MCFLKLFNIFVPRIGRNNQSTTAVVTFLDGQIDNISINNLNFKAMKDISFSVKFTTYRIGNPLEWHFFCNRISDVINTGNNRAALSVFIEPPMSKKDVDQMVRLIVEMIRKKHKREAVYRPDNSVFAAGSDDDFLREITFYFSYQIK